MSCAPQGPALLLIESARRHARKVEKILVFVLNELGERARIFGEGFYTCIPGLRVGRRFFGGPIAFRPLGRFIFRISRKLENIVLRDAQMFKQLPGRMRAPGVMAAHSRAGKSFSAEAKSR